VFGFHFSISLIYFVQAPIARRCVVARPFRWRLPANLGDLAATGFFFAGNSSRSSSNAILRFLDELLAPQAAIKTYMRHQGFSVHALQRDHCPTNGAIRHTVASAFCRAADGRRIFLHWQLDGAFGIFI